MNALAFEVIFLLAVLAGLWLSFAYRFATRGYPLRFGLCLIPAFFILTTITIRLINLAGSASC